MTLRAWARRLTVSMSTVVLLAALAGSAQAAPVRVVNASGIREGADGVTVTGASYNVRVLDGTCAVFAGPKA